MTEAEVREEWDRLGTSLFVANYVLDGTPFLFGGDREAYLAWRHDVASMLNVDPGNIFLVGSACVGCSLAPDGKFSAFSMQSDIDVAVVSTFHFDVAWRAIRYMNKLVRKSSAQQDAINEHRKRHIFDGCIATERFLGLLPFGADWSRTAISLSGNDPIQGRAVQFRIYRDLESLRSYHERGVEALLA